MTCRTFFLSISQEIVIKLLTGNCFLTKTTPSQVDGPLVRKTVDVTFNLQSNYTHDFFFGRHLYYPIIQKIMWHTNNHANGLLWIRISLNFKSELTNESSKQTILKIVVPILQMDD